MPYAHFFFALSRNIESFVVAGGYPFLFFVVLLEGLPLIGTAIPGHISIIVAGFLARMGVFNIYWVISVTVVAALLGDYIGFTLGRKYGLSLIARLRPYFFIKDAHIDRARKMLDTHTGKAMILGRFSPVTRALMPFLVGTGEIKAGKFWFYNIVGGVCWAVLSIMLGYVFGEGYHYASGYFGKIAVAGIILAILIMWGYRFINSRFHIFAKYELFSLGLNIISLVLLAVTVQDAWSGNSFMANFDVVVNTFMDRIGHLYPIVISVATFVTTIGSMYVTGGLGILFGVSLMIKKRWRLGLIFIFSTSTTLFVLGIMKEFFMRMRPDNALVILADNPSFPSGHACMAAVFFVLLTYLVVPRVKTHIKRELLIVVFSLSVFVVGMTRVVLNVHWASDVIAGWAVGAFIATSFVLLVRYLGVLVVRKK
ncbi:MAG: bifunctional DedA family/phosphatase PAP2 family protein [Candidatus Taylorbacteria bacterium]